MVQRLLKIMLLVAACGLFIANAHATIIVSGDASITRMISTTIPQIYNQGDQQFFENIVNGSTDIAVVNKYGTNLFAGDINTFYQSLGNVNSTLISTITETSLGNADMLIIPVPEDAFSNEEMVLMNSYINGGGAVFFLGDCSNFSSNNAIINQTLLGIGSTLSIIDDTLDRGLYTAKGNQIVGGSNYTNNIQSFNYAFVSGVSGGNPLFLTTNGTPFISYEQLRSVPEPSMAMLFLISMPALLLTVRKKR